MGNLRKPLLRGALKGPLRGYLDALYRAGSNILASIKAMNPLIATDPNLLSSANDGRPQPQRTVREFDGATQSITVPHLIGSETVSEFIGTATPTVNAGSISFTAGTACKLVLSDGTQFDFAENGGTTALNSADSTKHGTYVNAPAVVVDNTCPHDPLNESGLSEYAYFNGVDSEVAFNQVSMSGDFTLSFSIVANPSATGRRSIFGISINGSNFLRKDGSTMRLAIAGSSFDISSGTINDGLPHSHRLERVGAILSWYIDDILIRSDSVSTAVLNLDTIGQKFNGDYFDGYIYDVNLDSQVSYSGYGVDGWSDQIGSNDGTPTNVTTEHAPASTTQAGLDAIGNPLQWGGTVYPVNLNETQNNTLQFDGLTQSIALAGLTGSETVVESFGTSVPTIAPGVINFTAGYCSGLTLSNGYQLPLAEGSGSTAYCRDGVNHGTLVNAPTRVLADDVPAFNLLNGFGKYAYFNGVDSGVVMDGVTFDPSSFVLEATVIPESSAGATVIGGYSSLTTQVLCEITATVQRIDFNMRGDGSVVYVDVSTPANSAPVGVESKVRVVGDGSNIEIFINGISVLVEPYTPQPTSMNKCSIGVRSRSSDSGFYQGLIYDASIDGVEYLDKSWSSVDDQYTLLNDSNEVYIPAINATTDAIGQPLTNPFVENGHNGAETTYSTKTADDGEQLPAIKLAGLPETWATGDPETTRFQFATISGGNDRFLGLPEDPTPEEQATIDEYHL